MHNDKTRDTEIILVRRLCMANIFNCQHYLCAISLARNGGFVKWDLQKILCFANITYFP